MKRIKVTYSGPDAKPVAPIMVQKRTVKVGCRPAPPGKQKQRDIVKRTPAGDLETFNKLLGAFLSAIPDAVQREFDRDPALCESLFESFVQSLKPEFQNVIKRTILL